MLKLNLTLSACPAFLFAELKLFFKKDAMCCQALRHLDHIPDPHS